MPVSGRPRCAAEIVAENLNAQKRPQKNPHPCKNRKDGPPEDSPTGSDVVDAQEDVYYDLFPV